MKVQRIRLLFGGCGIAVATLFVMMSATVSVQAQGVPNANSSYENLSYSELHALGKELLSESKRQEAIAVYTRILQTHPTDPDALLLRGRIYSWEKQWVEAEADLLAAADRSPTYADVWHALGDMYRWTDRYDLSIEAYQKWAELKPDDPAPREAIASARRSQRYSIPMKWEIKVKGRYDDFSEDRQEWKEGTIDLSHRFGWGKGILRVRHADRFDRTDQQVELEGYPKLWESAYGFFNVGTSVSERLYPRIGYSLAIYQSLPYSFEIAPGYRHMEFGNNNVDIYWLTLGKYFSNYYFNVRGTHVPKTGGESQSLKYELRRYFGNSDRWVGINYSHGSSTEIDTREDLTFANAEGFGMDFEWWPTRKWGYRLSASYDDEAGRPIQRTYTSSFGFRW